MKKYDLYVKTEKKGNEKFSWENISVLTDGCNSAVQNYEGNEVL